VFSVESVQSDYKEVFVSIEQYRTVIEENRVPNDSLPGDKL
jgi:hypothetical protein